MRTDIQNTCFKCPDRKVEPNCHGYCERYLNAVEERKKRQEYIKQNKRFDVEYQSCKVKNVAETKKKSHR